MMTLLVATCGSGTSDPAARSLTGVAGQDVSQATSLRVMSFNIEWGGTHVRFDSLKEAIRAAGADVVGIQEAEGNLARLADDLGWQYSRRAHVISTYPIIDPPEAGGRYVLIEVLPGRVVAIANVHLPSAPSGAAWFRAGRTPEEIIEMERRIRLPMIQPSLEALPGLIRQELPVFLSGDFNAPSHEDWTEAAVGKFPNRDYVVAWPVTRAVAAAGLRDSFRDIHPDPVADPGFTWWAARPKIRDYNPTDASRRTRIDFIWYGGPAKVTDSHLVGEEGAPEVAVTIAPWPSDHRAVVSEFEVRPAPIPLLVAAERRVHISGQPLGFVYRNTTPRGFLVIERHGGGDIFIERRIGLEAESGRLDVHDTGMSPAAYQVVLQDPAGEEVSRNQFWIVAPDAKPSIALAGERFASGDPLPLVWRNGPGNRYDWIGVYEQGATEEQSHRIWGYVGASSSGRMQLSASNVREGWPLPPGRYVARYLLDDGYALLAESAPFIVD